VFSDRPEAHDEITQTRGSWEQTLAAVHSARNAGLPVEFHFVPIRRNYACLPGLAAHAAKLGVRQISVLRLVPQGRAKCDKDLLLSDDENLRLREVIEGARKHCRIRLGSPYSILHASDSQNCMAGVNRLTIAPDLRIYPCDAFKRIESMEIAWTNELSSVDKWSLSECWLRSPYLRTIRDHLRQPFNSPCSDCTHLPNCKSGCPAQKYLRRGELSRVPDPMCLQMAKR
jgi:radical SAM protein with 4Fe4S-binding SPASM domain